MEKQVPRDVFHQFDHFLHGDVLGLGDPRCTLPGDERPDVAALGHEHPAGQLAVGHGEVGNDRRDVLGAEHVERTVVGLLHQIFGAGRVFGHAGTCGGHDGVDPRAIALGLHGEE
jgi:hypothetical protein